MTEGGISLEQNIGKHLKSARNGAHKSVKEVSEYLRLNDMNISEKTIYGWENGHSQPSPDALLLLCSFYGIDDVLGYFGYKKSPSDDEDPLDEDEGALMLYKALISAGFLKEGEDLTPQQFEFLDGLTAMLSAFFDSQN
nr:MAG TPA: helix-turn-helix domain protein [Caudoviricetes sp.]